MVTLALQINWAYDLVMFAIQKRTILCYSLLDDAHVLSTELYLSFCPTVNFLTNKMDFKKAQPAKHCKVYDCFFVMLQIQWFHGIANSARWTKKFPSTHCSKWVIKMQQEFYYFEIFTSLTWLFEALTT